MNLALLSGQLSIQYLFHCALPPSWPPKSQAPWTMSPHHRSARTAPTFWVVPTTFPLSRTSPARQIPTLLPRYSVRITAVALSRLIPTQAERATAFFPGPHWPLCIGEETRLHMAWVLGDFRLASLQRLGEIQFWLRVYEAETHLRVGGYFMKWKITFYSSGTEQRYTQFWLFLFVFLHASKKKKKSLLVMWHKHHRHRR